MLRFLEMDALLVKTRRAAACLAAILAFMCGVLVCRAILTERTLELRGLLIDLELSDPNPSEHAELRDALENPSISGSSGVERMKVRLEYLHFTELHPLSFQELKPHFIALSPQNTPWSAYPLRAGPAFARAKQVVKTAAVEGATPILGVCGGHQFMALAFGGEVDFIDPAFEGKRLDGYPKEAVKERGVLELTTVIDDPILQGVAAHPGVFRVSESHYEEVKGVPAPFVNIARSALSETQLIRLPGRPVYGLAFHPERGWGKDGPPLKSTHGGRILANFLAMAARNRR